MTSSFPSCTNNTLDEIESLRTTAVSKLHWWSRPDWATVFQAIEEKTDAHLKGLVAPLPDDEVKLGKLIDVIKARREKLSLTSSITNQVVGICKQILAFGAAGLAVTVGFGDKLRTFSVGIQKLFVLAGIFYIELVLLSLLVLIWYMLQAHFRYPFLYLKKIGNAWTSFYYSSISPEVKRAPIQGAKARLNAGALYARDFIRFAERCLSETPKERLRAEIQQYFLLMAYQGYVQQFALRLANVFFYGFAGSVFSTLALAVVAWVH